jgi:Rps23 Pro-64 3,4-dihydroxylase Tpa1-like proline 4-hydroxylase
LEEFESVHSKKWTKAWPVSDGNPLCGKVYISHPSSVENTSTLYPSGNAFDILIRKIIENRSLFEKYVGVFDEDWKYFYCRPYVYNANSGLSWHQDSHLAISGAYSFYCHKHWNVGWGGELLIDKFDNVDFALPLREKYEGGTATIGCHIDNTPMSENLMQQGLGTFIQPRPNRLVVLKKGILHTIKKVDSAAGSNLRMTLQGFFMNP